MKSSGLVRAAAAVSAVAAMWALSMTAPAWAGQPPAKSDTKATDAKPAGTSTKDKLIFKSGREVVGTILKEDDRTVRILVVVGTIKGEQTYEKSEILAIERGQKA